MLPRPGCCGRSPAWIGLLQTSGCRGARFRSSLGYSYVIPKQRCRRSFRLFKIRDYVKSGLVPVQPKILQVKNKKSQGNHWSSTSVFQENRSDVSFLDQEHSTALPQRLSILAYCLVLNKHKTWAHKGSLGGNSSNSRVPIQASSGMSFCSSRRVEDALSPPALLPSFSFPHIPSFSGQSRHSCAHWAYSLSLYQELQTIPPFYYTRMALRNKGIESIWEAVTSKSH